VRDCGEGGLSEEEEDVFAEQQVLAFDEGVGDAAGVVGQGGVARLVEGLVHQQQVSAVRHQQLTAGSLIRSVDRHHLLQMPLLSSLTLLHI
jgi:hypothetical protein